jgi:hypothetical protein
VSPVFGSKKTEPSLITAAFKPGLPWGNEWGGGYEVRVTGRGRVFVGGGRLYKKWLSWGGGAGVQNEGRGVHVQNGEEGERGEGGQNIVK